MIYIASPYSSQSGTLMQLRFEQVECFTANLLNAGIFAFSPIVYGHEIAKSYTLPTSAEWWKEFNRHMLLASRGMYILMLDGWRESVGVRMEREWALEAKLPISFYRQDGDQYLCSDEVY